MVALNAMPRVVLAPLFILWFGLGLTSKVVMVISLVFFVVFFSTYTGIREVDRDLVSNARILGATPGHMIRHVLLPSALTWIFSSLRTSVGFALIGAVVGEYLGSHEGMGYVISYAEAMFNATGVLAGLLVLMAAVIAIDLGLKRLDRRFSYWKPVR
jgi:NitT/TauT family transport system permease protein